MRNYPVNHLRFQRTHYYTFSSLEESSERYGYDLKETTFEDLVDIDKDLLENQSFMPSSSNSINSLSVEENMNDGDLGEDKKKFEIPSAAMNFIHISEN